MTDEMFDKMLYDMLNDFINFAIRNPIYFICSAIYYISCSLILGGGKRGFLIAFILYVISLVLVFSPIGEKIIRLFERIRKAETLHEKALLIPILFEVCEEVTRQQIHIGRMEICVIDKMTVNVCAVGKHTIAVSKGAMEVFTEDELKGVIAHEIGHIINLDTTAQLYAMIGNGLMTLYFLIVRFVLYLIELMHEIEGKSKAMKFAISLVRLFFELNVFLSMFVMQIALSINSRKNEFRADNFAYDLGYGEEMIQALYLIEKIQLGDNSNLIQKMTASHPRITARIERLENLFENDRRNIYPY